MLKESSTLNKIILASNKGKLESSNIILDEVIIKLKNELKIVVDRQRLIKSQRYGDSQEIRNNQFLTVNNRRDINKLQVSIKSYKLLKNIFNILQREKKVFITNAKLDLCITLDSDYRIFLGNPRLDSHRNAGTFEYVVYRLVLNIAISPNIKLVY